MTSILLTFDSQLLNSTDHSVCTLNFDVPIELKGKWGMSLISASIPYSCYNISDKYNNRIINYSLDSGVTWKTITIPSGNYSFSGIQQAVKALLEEQNDYVLVDGKKYYPFYLYINSSIGKCFCELDDGTHFTGVQVDFITNTNIYKLLGFDSSQMPIKASPVVAQNNLVIFSHRSFRIECDAISQGIRANVNNNNTLYSSTFNGEIFGLINVEPTSKIYLPLRNNLIDRITMSLKFEDGTPYDTNSEPVSYVIELKRLD